MLGVGGGVAPPSTAPATLRRATENSKPICFSLLSQHQSHKANLSFFQVPNYTQLLAGRCGFQLSAQKKHKGSSIELEKKADFELDEFEDEFDEEDEDFDEDEGDNDDDLMIPFEKMDAWLKNKPRGFGEGKVYDTSVEDKLLEEIEQSRKSQLANVDKLKNETQESKPNIELNKELKASEVVSTDIRVRINNLPKKKNVHRDLKSAFQGVQGIVNISPVVFGNKKTRDPICKGFGFVDFKSLQDANRFVQMFSGQSVAFGKIEKQIKCEILKSDNGASKGSVQLGPSSSFEPKLAPLEVVLDQDPNSIQENDPNLLYWEDDDFDEFDEEFDDEDVIDDIKLPRASEKGENDDIELELELEPDSSSSKYNARGKAVEKKSVTNRKQDKIPQLSIPESAMRLKVREKAELSEVFSRSGAKEASISKEIFMASEDGGDQDPDTEENDPSLQFWEDDDFDEDDEELVDEDDAQNIDLVRALDQEDNKSTELNVKPSPSSALSIHNEKKTTKADAKKSVVTEKPEVTPKLSIQALAKMLKIRDTAKLEEFISRSRASKDTGDQIANIEEDLLQFLGEDGFDDEEEEEEETEDDLKFLNALKQGENYDTEPRMKAELDSSSLPKKREKANAAKKKPVVKEKASKTPKVKIPGSARRLKGQDKAKLEDVFTKYGSKKALASKDM